MNKINKQLVKITEELTPQENEEQLLQQLSQMSRQFTTNDVSQVISINFDQATTQGIDNMLNKYYSFLGQKRNKLQEMQRYLDRLVQNVVMAKKYFDKHKQTADQIVDKCPRFKELSNSPKIRTKTTPRSQAFFRKRDLVQL